MNNKITAQLKQWRETKGIIKPIGHPNFQTAVELEIDEYTEACRANNQHEKIDAINDILIFCLNELALEGYAAELTLKETIKEISSRKGSLDETGRFNKDKNQPDSELYKANFSHCKIQS